MALRIDYIADWAARLRGLLYTQFRDAVTWQQLTDDVLGPQFQALEDAAQQLLSLFSIDDSEGVQLDILGRVVGQPRNSVSDALYRVYLRARILANRSTGTVEDLYRVLNALLGAVGFSAWRGAVDVKTFIMTVVSPITATQALVALEFLRASKEAGAAGILKWQEYPTAETFRYDYGPGFDSGHYAGASRA